MRRAKPILAVLASGALHGLVLWGLPRGTLEKSAPYEHVLQFELHSLPPLPATSAVPSEPAPALSSQDTPAPARGSRLHKRAAPAAAVLIPPPSALPPPSRETTREPPSRSPERAPSAPAYRPLDLHPLAVARTLVDVHALPVSPTDHTVHIDTELERRREAQLAAAFPELSRTSQQGGQERVDHTAQDALAFAERPWKAIIEPLRRGRYQYRGKNFDAVILSDGRIEYRQKTGLSLSMMQSVLSGGAPDAVMAALAFHTLIQKLTGDHLAVAERNRFLEHTRALRDLLHERARRFHMQAADGRLEKRLRRLLASHSEREAQHDAVFELWLECADDEIGELGREHIERTLRELCPPASACGFRTEDLGRLNARRGPRAPFNPYAQDMPSVKL